MTSKPVGMFTKSHLCRSINSILRRSHVTAVGTSTTTVLMICAAAHAQDTPGSAANPTTLGEVVVTAQRRSESIQDVPYNISAVGGEALEQADALSINDLARVVPGLTTVDTGPAARDRTNNFTLRGLRTDSPGGGASGPALPGLSVSPVSTYFGETPIFFPMSLQDVERIEVLRGPQGTLYGSGAQAGTIRFIPKSPEFDQFSGEVDAEGSHTENAPNANGSVHGVLNIPIADNLALRLVGGDDRMGGFIDEVGHWKFSPSGIPVPANPADQTSGPTIGSIERGANWSDQWIGRAALRWKASDAIDVELGYLHQGTQGGDSQLSNPTWQGGTFDLTNY